MSKIYGISLGANQLWVDNEQLEIAVFRLGKGTMGGLRTIPTIPKPSPPEPVTVTVSAPPRVSYFKDNTQPVPPLPVSTQGWSSVASLNRRNKNLTVKDEMT